MHETQKYSTLTRLILLLFIAEISFFAQNTFAQTDPEIIAKEYFELGHYEQALPHFEDLVNLYPKDPMLNYYYAVCLIETELFSTVTQTAIQNAFGDNSPPKIFYYQAQVLHADNDFQLALSFYQRFIDEAKRRTVRSTQVDELIGLCKQGINPFSKIEKPEVVEAITEELPKQVEPEVKKPVEIPSNLKDSIIRFQVTPTIHYLKINQFKNEASIHSFLKGWLIEQDIDALLQKTKLLRVKYSSVPEYEKMLLADEILQLEQEAYTLNQKLEKFYLKAREKEIAYWAQASPVEISNFQRKISMLEDSISIAFEASYPDEVKLAVPVELPDKIDLVFEPSPQQNTNQLIYKIQIGAYRKSPPQWVQNLYRKLSVIRRIDNYTDDQGVTVYTVGELSSFDDAVRMQKQIKLEGVKDAFIAAYKNGERIPVKEARELTN